MLSFRVYILCSHYAVIGRRVELTESIAAHHSFVPVGNMLKSMGNRISLSGRISLYWIDYLGKMVERDSGIKK